MTNFDIMTTVSENIRELLTRHGMTQEQLAQATELKQSAISRLITSEDANPTIKTLQAIADAFRIEVSDLLKKKRKKVLC